MAELEEQIRRYADVAQAAVPGVDLDRVRRRSRRPATFAFVGAGLALVVGGIVAGMVLRSDSEVTTSTASTAAGGDGLPAAIVPTAADPLPIDDYVCDDQSGEAICYDGVVLGTATYSFTCALPRESDLGPILGLPGTDPRFVEARAVAGEDPALVIALISSRPLDLQSVAGSRGQADTCTQPTNSVLAYGRTQPQRTAEAARETGRLQCEVPAVPDYPLCAAGGPFQYFLDPSVDGTEGDEHRSIWLDDTVAATNAALEDGGGPREYLDPLDLVQLSHDYVQRSSLRTDEDLYRVGARIVDQAPGRMVIEVLHQNGQQLGSKLVYTTQREEFTYEQLGGGPGWWETRFIVREYSNDNPRSGPDARSAMDADWADCCDSVLVELER